ncbi:MAG: hypothetical protein VB118_01200 [Oscillospiraceae bacterium]|nr:hypothetical protein [Oscillospiraceae bacterium]
MKKKLKIRITVFATCALLMFLMVTSALALTVESPASVRIGSTSKVVGPIQTLTKASLTGHVVSYSTSTGSRSMYGAMVTRGSVWIYTRDSASVSPGCAVYDLAWDNGSYTGTFWAEAIAENGNHNGDCTIYQDH